MGTYSFKQKNDAFALDLTKIMQQQYFQFAVNLEVNFLAITLASCAVIYS